MLLNLVLSNFKFSTPLKQIPHRGYRLARNWRLPRRSKKNFSVGMTRVNWWLSDPLFVAGCIEARLRNVISYLKFQNWQLKFFSVNVSSSLPAFLGRQVNFAFEKSEICIENSINLLTSNYFSIQFSIENHSKWQPWSDWRPIFHI